MCGIAGYVGNGRLPRTRIEACLELMKRRGPDHQDYRHWTTPDGRTIALLHSRLSIIDLDQRANQPFNLHGKWMVFNGELYNYLELKADLSACGHPFHTESDTEVLLRTVDHHGWHGLDRCEGMWAFAVFDEADGSLTLCRDRFGEKPLFLLRAADGLYFGSEVKFIRELLGQPLEVNYDQLRRFWVNGYKALYKKPETFFKDEGPSRSSGRPRPGRQPQPQRRRRRRRRRRAKDRLGARRPLIPSQLPHTGDPLTRTRKRGHGLVRIGFAVLKAMQSIFEAIQEASTRPVWSRGVQLVRANAVSVAEDLDREITLLVSTRGGLVAPEVTLRPEDEDWECSCSSVDDPCEHIVASVIAIRQSEKSGKGLPVQGEGRLGFQFRARA